ncbi:uncharacterized protein LOC109281489 isoform X2 [Alligator mississippiensis]|uniref:uncharacterized protein LOC109281489 isoform X2 n=1 Tax=Alligator mississippiensis TaxID=8496 RepID=UPI0009073728|nr:uncharacterized protein LOC109281489 isoform X2 [Alligator mississippiensis]XP_019336326.1 uncharacterized protein LOC109281489 isoform X2 [Alligator mississippiensis]XP_019336328.1 uncharacterized protein LOC109281489 isoform X2 [Alligator mississippiensis]XP_059580644.1 uncharacterized protein LOC109281489 isoform X2 [Alligator mississippiensis]XP_059580645.1 uncharacterized protein LOC109281489 isoform X2 [Alligator mississippiensis]XP_059580646.1 uncharacterized protein LOC109281489 iso
MQVSQISLLQLLTDSFISLRDTDDNLALQTFCTGVGLEVEEEKAAAAAPPQGETMSQLLRDCSLFPDDQLQEEPSSAGPAAVTHGNWEWHPAHTSAECCKDFHSKQRQSCETSLMVLAESSVPRAQREAAWWDELHDAMRKDHAILKEVRDTIRNLKDTVDKSSADFQSSNDIFKKALQKYLKNEWVQHPKGKNWSAHLASVKDEPVPPNSLGSQQCHMIDRRHCVSGRQGRLRVMVV